MPHTPPAPAATARPPGARPPGARPRGGDNLTEDEIGQNIRSMFDRVAPRYDVLNRLLSGRVDVYWRRRTVRALREYLAKPQARILDLCCGTADLAAALESRRARLCGTGRHPVLGMDFSHPMLLGAQHKLPGKPAALVEADSLHLPLADGYADVITIAYGFRNLANYPAALREFTRVLAPGGCLAILEFSQPKNPLFARAFSLYFRHILPPIGNSLSGAGDAYSYLQQSVERFYSPAALQEEMQTAGLENVSFQLLTGGISALHLGYRAI